VIHGAVLLPALQANLLQDSSFLQPLHLNSRQKEKRSKKKKMLPAGQRREEGEERGV